jgi:cytidylate kinase
MFRRISPVLVLIPGVLVAQAKTAAPATWMDLAPGTDVSYSIEDENRMEGGVGTGSGGSGKHAVRIVALGPDASGALRVAVFDEQLPKESFETAIVRAEIAVLDATTGALQRDAAAASGPLAAMWSPQVVFPFPALTAAEWKGKKAVARTGWAPVAGEPRELPLKVSFTTRKDGKKMVPALLVELDSKEPVAVKLVGIAGMVSMAQGKMPKLGASGVEPVDAEVSALRRECTIDPAKGRVSEIRTTGTVVAADGKLKIACSNTQRETERRVVEAKDLPLAVEVVEELCAIVASQDAKEERRKRVEALAPKAKQAGFAATAERLLDSFTRNGLPPGVGR